MSREIKFRIWNGSQMEHNVIVGKLGAFYVQGMDEKDTASLSPFNTKYHENTPIMQFTGVLDKNNKDVYESDIVKFKYWRDAYQRFEETTKEVKYKNGFFSPLISFEDKNSIDYEVIGNVYQNPDLLK